MVSARFPIPGFPGYEATEEGQIVKVRTGKIKRQRRATTGAVQVDIGKSTRMVHDLVARAFYGHPLVRGYRVRHWNGDAADNTVDNLLWRGYPIYEDQLPTTPLEIEREYERIELERLELIELMQT